MAKRKTRIHLSRAQLAFGSLALAILGWAGFLYYTYWMPPAGATYPGFFAILFVAATCTVLPIILVIDGRRRSSWRLVRMAIWIGLWVTLCVWLQLLQLLNWGTAILFLAIFALIEWFIMSRK
jgi:hypothetical protein